MARPLNHLIDDDKLLTKRLHILTVQLGDKFYINALGARSLALVVIGTVTKTIFFSGFGHRLDALSRLYLALRQNSKLGNLGTGV